MGKHLTVFTRFDLPFKVSVLQQEPHDNVFVDVSPGEEYNYEYEIEADHPAGTYWYHAHLHGATMFQVSLLQCLIL